MAAIDYTGIGDGLKTILEADALTSDARVYIEEEPQFGLSDAEKAIIIYLDRRIINPTGQPIAAGKRTPYHVYFIIWSLYFTMANYKAACDGRNALLANLELVLMKERTIGGKATSSWLEGGQLITARDGGTQTFVSAGETILVAEVSAINA